MSAIELVNAVLEGEDPKYFFRHGSPVLSPYEAQFMDAYYSAMLWTSTLPPFGECPHCGAEAVLDRWNEADEPVCSNCAAREPDHSPAADENYSVQDISRELKAKSTNDCLSFIRQNSEDLDSVVSIGGYPAMAMAGHDFWLTREGHGVGFRDRDGWGEEAKNRLHRAARRFGEVSVYVGDNGKIYA